MARIRYLKPDFFKDEDIKDLPFEVRLFYQGLWCFADKEGRLEDRPERLRVEIMPYDNIDIEKIMALLIIPKRNTGKPYILRYKINGEKYIQILSWRKHQKPHYTEKESIIPPPTTDYPVIQDKKRIPVKDTLNTVYITNKVGRNGEGNGEGIHTLSGSKDESDSYKIIITFLNEQTGKNYKTTTPKTRLLIKTRMVEGFTVDDFLLVIKNKVKDWAKDLQWNKFLRPETLFGTKFESYLNENPKGGDEDGEENL